MHVLLCLSLTRRAPFCFHVTKYQYLFINSNNESYHFYNICKSLLFRITIYKKLVFTVQHWVLSILLFVCKIPLLLYARYLCSLDALGLKAKQRYAKRELGGRCVRAFQFYQITFRFTYETRMTLYIGDMSTKNLENRLPFELQCWSATHFEGFVELSALPLYLKRFGGIII